ncbi:DUF2786 domain-containing protein [Gordonia sp. UBA5067]|uniref:DUF2786 domain-containing protein n=1 Tax=Gordonia sp. UBA5067 TaxID=1946575 RepID=UPI0025BE68BB|nr:DUF2786 domain-containing protein [Gordonia sp. UBA5067]
MRDDKTLARIAALLRQAEGTDNEHEAQTFMTAAQRLATAASIDLARARAHDRAARERTVPVARQVTIGQAGKRGLRTYVHLFVAIAAANDVTLDVAHNSTFVLAYGFDADIDAVEALYTSLLIQMVAASDAYLKSGDYKGERAARVVRRGSGWRSRRGVEQTPLSPITARLNFQSAFAERVGARLQAARADTCREAARADSARGARRAEPSTAIMLRHKEIEVANFYAAQSTARGSWRAARAGAGYSDAARRAGDRAGRRARLAEQERLGAPRDAIEG